MSTLVAYCFHCSNMAFWDDEKKRMCCHAIGVIDGIPVGFINGIPEEVMTAIYEGKGCPLEEMPDWDEDEED